MKRLAEQFAFWVCVSFVAALVMTSAACPDNEVFCLAR